MAALMVPATGTLLRRIPQDFPVIKGNLLIIACGDSRLHDEAGQTVAEILRITQAPWGFLKTYAGGSRALTRSDAVAQAFFGDEVAGLEELRGEPFAAVLDLSHLYCAGLGLHEGDIPVPRQLAVIDASQAGALRVYGRYFAGRPAYFMAYDPMAMIWR
jgi:hypothetical protein